MQTLDKAGGKTPDGYKRDILYTTLFVGMAEKVPKTNKKWKSSPRNIDQKMFCEHLAKHSDHTLVERKQNSAIAIHTVG